MAEKRGPLSSEKALNSKPTRATEQTMSFHANTTKKAKKCQTMTYMPNTIFSCQTTLKKAKFQEFGLKMPTWQPC